MRRNKRDWTTIFIYELDSYTNHRIDFSLGDLTIEEMLFMPLFDSFYITQIIPKDSTFKLSPDFLDYNKINYIGTVGTIKYGLFKNKSRVCFHSDLIIPYTRSKFIYEFTFGNYIYAATDKTIDYDIDNLVKWYAKCKFNDEDKDELYSGNINDNFSFPDFIDFFLMTNYDNNIDLGIVLKKDKTRIIIDWIKSKVMESQIDDYKYQKFENCKRTGTL